MPADISFKLVPAPLVVPDFLARGADGQEAAQLFYFLPGLAEFFPKTGQQKREGEEINQSHDSVPVRNKGARVLSASRLVDRQPHQGARERKENTRSAPEIPGHQPDRQKVEHADADLEAGKIIHQTDKAE